MLLIIKNKQHMCFLLPQSREVGSSSHGVQSHEHTKVPSKTPHDAKGARGNPQETKDKTTHIKNTTKGSSISTDGSGEEKVIRAHGSKLPTVSDVKANGDTSKLPMPGSRSTRPSPQVIILHRSTDASTASHDPASHDPASRYTKMNHSSHDPKANRSSSAQKQIRSGPGEEVATSGPVKQRPTQSSYGEDDIDIPQSKSTVHYMEDLHNMKEVTIVNMGRSGFTQDTPEFLPIGSGEEKSVWYGDPAPMESHAKEEKKKKKGNKPSSKSESPTKESSNVAEAWARPDPKVGVAVSPSDPLSPALSSTSHQGSPLPRCHSSPPEVKLRNKSQQQDQRAQSVQDGNPLSPSPTFPHLDHDPAHTDTPHSNSSPERKSKSIFKRFSDSFMRARSRPQHQQKAPERTSWYFTDPSALPSTVSELRLDTLTEKERLAVMEDLEVIPRAQSLQHLGGCPVVNSNQWAILGGEGHARISLAQAVKVSSVTSLTHREDDDDDLKSSSTSALHRFTKDRKGMRHQSHSLSDMVESPLDSHTRGPPDSHTGKHLIRSAESEATPMEHQATPMEHQEGSVEEKGAADCGKSTTEQKPRKKSFIANFLHKDKKPSSNGPSVHTIEENAAPDPVTQAPIGTTKVPIETTKVPIGATKAPIETTKAPIGTTKAPIGTTKAPIGTTKTSTAAKNSAFAAKNTPGSPVVARNVPVAAKKVPAGPTSSLSPQANARGLPNAAKKSPNSPVAAKNSPTSRKYSLNSPMAVRNSPIAARKLSGSPDTAKRSPISAKSIHKQTSAETQPSNQSPTSSKRISAPSQLTSKKQSSSSSLSKKQSSSSSSSITPHSSKQNFDLAASSPDSLQSPVFESPMHRKRKVGVLGPTSPVTPPSTPVTPPSTPSKTSLNIVITQQVSDAAAAAAPPTAPLNSKNKPEDLDTLLREADTKLSRLQGNGPSNVEMGRGLVVGTSTITLTPSPPMSPLPSLLADHFYPTSSSHSRQSSGEVDIDDVPSPTEGASQTTPEHHATHLPSKNSRSVPNLVLSHDKGGAHRDKGGASVGEVCPTAHFDGAAAKADKPLYTSALPPRPPSKKWNSAVTASQQAAAASSESTRLALSDASVLSKKKVSLFEVKSPAKSTLKRSTKGRSSVAARASTKKKLSSKDLPNAQPISKLSISRVKSPDLPLTKDSTIKATPLEGGTGKRTSDSAVMMKHVAGGSGTLKRTSDTGSLRRTSDTGTLKRGSTAMRSVRSSVEAQPSSTIAGRKSRDTLLSPSHLPVKRVSSGDTMRLSKAHSSMRAPSIKMGALSRGQHVGGGALSQGDKDTLSRKSIRKASDDIAAFNQISAEVSV